MRTSPTRVQACTTWTQILATGPIGVKNAALAYHTGRKQIVLWGLDGCSGLLVVVERRRMVEHDPVGERPESAAERRVHLRRSEGERKEGRPRGHGGADSDCQSGFVCNVSTGTCGAGDKCVGSVVTKVDGTTVGCAPYTCESSGRCKTACATTADCVSPTICNGAACVDFNARGVEDGGGCALSHRGVRGSTALLLTAGALAGALFRRRRVRVIK